MVDYKYYTDTFHGNKIPESDFASNEYRAAAYVDKITRGRSAGSELDSVKDAVCAAAEVFFTSGQGEGISSENNDGYSVTYARSSTNQTMSSAYQAARIFLPGEMLYRGVEE